MTGPAVYSPDNPFAPKATAPVTYSPDNPFAPKPTALPPLRPLPLTAARDVTATAVDQTAPALEQQLRARTLPGQLEAAPGQVAEIAGEAVRHPLRTIAGMAKATVEAPYLTGRYAGQQLLPKVLPIAEPVRDVTGKEALAGAAMMAAPAVAPVIGTLPTAALTGAAFMPDQPIAGGLIGAALWGANRLRTGAPQRLVPEEPGAPNTTATARVAGRALPAGPDYEVTANEPVPGAPVAPEAAAPALAAPQAPKLLPRLRRVAPEEPEAPARPAAPAAAPPAEPARAPSAGSYLPDEEVSLPAPVPVRARTESGRLMSNLGKATPEQLAGEYRALIDAHEQDLGAAQGGVRIFGSLDYADDPSSGGHLGDVGMVATPAGMKASGRLAQRQKSIDKIEAELTKRGIEHADAYWMGGGEEVPGGVGEARPTYSAVTPEQRNRFEAVRWSAARALEIGKQRQAELEKPAGPPDLEPAFNRESGVGEGKARYGKGETLTGVAFRRKDSGEVYSMEGFDGGHSQLFDDIESNGIPTVDMPGDGRFERATATFDHGFMTSSGRFVDRAEALKIARASHQLESEERAKNFGMAAENIKNGRVSETPEYEPAPKLAVLHNLSADNLEFADKMGGLAVPSLGVVKQGQHYSGMGEITLLGKPHLGDPTTVPIHDADVYSTTFPRPEYPKARTKDAQKLVNELRDEATRFDDRRLIDTVWDNAVNTPKPEDSVVQMLRSPAAQAVFLKSKGIEVKPVLEKATVEPGFVTTKAWRDFQRTTGYEPNHSYADTTYREKLAAAVKSAIEEQVARRKDPQIRDLMRSALLKQWIGEDGLVPFGYSPRIDRGLAAVGRMDVERTKTEAKLAEALKGHENEFRDWVEKKILPMHGEPFLRLGRKRVPFTLANVVEAMTGPIKNQEKTMTFGEGQARAASAMRLSSLQHMRNASYQIEGEATIEKAREHAKKLLSSFRDAVLPYFTEHDWKGNIDTWRGLDASMRAVARWAKGRGMAEALRAEGFRGVPQSVVTQAIEAGRAFKDAPVPYFEAKPQRAVTLDEFAGAVIPKSASPKVRELLAKHGIETEEYSSSTAGEPERGAAIARLQDRLEQKGNGVLFERPTDARQLDAFTPAQLDAFDAAPAVDARAVEKFGSMDEAQRAIALVEQHAGKFATTYKGPTPRMKGRLQKVGLRNKGGSMVDLVGQKISGPRDLAKALYPFRSPLHERFFTIVHGAEGKILAATMDTSGAVNYVTPYGGGKSGMMRFIEEIVRRAQRVGGTEVTIAHNHPSGLTNQSADDISFWNWMGYQLQQRGIRLRGQLVIDHDEASWVTPGQNETKLPVPPGGPDWVDLNAAKVASPEALAAYVGAGANNGGLHVVYVNAQMQVIALEPHNPSALKTIGVWLPAHGRGMGAAGALLVGPKGAALDISAALGQTGIGFPIFDIVTADPHADGSVRFVSEAERGGVWGEAGTRGGRTEADEARKFRRLSETADVTYGTGGGRGDAGGAGGVPLPDRVGERGAEYKKARAAGLASGLTPEQADAYAAAAKDIDFDGAKAVAQAKAEAGGLRTRLRRWADAAADQTREIDRISREAVKRGMPEELAPEYELALSYNSDDTIRRALYNAPEMATTHGVLDPITRAPIGPTLESVVEPLGKDPEKIRQAFTYVVALRKAGRGLKATAGDPNELQAALDAVAALGKVPLYRKFAADLEAHLNAIGQYAVRSGLWTEAQWEQLKHSDLFYVPFRRLMTHIEPPPGKTTYGVKRANLSAGIETFEGSRRFLANPVEAVAGYDARIIKRADAYRVGSAVIDALSQYMGEEGKAILTPIAANDPAVKAFAAAAVRRNLARSGLNVAEVGMVADLAAPQIDPHNPVIWRNRKPGAAQPPVAQTDAFGEETPPEVNDREYYLLNDPELYKALVATRADSPLGNGALMAAFRIARRLMTVTTTGINPRFALGLNIARDVPQAMMQVPGIRPDDIAAATLEAVKAVVGSSEFADILARHGLGSASIYAHDVNPEAAARRIAPVTKLQKLGAQVRKIGGWPLETAERVGAASDLVARLAAARAARRAALAAGATPRGAIARAATVGIRSTVNFNRRAGVPVLQFLEQSVPFFGASMRSMLRATEAVGEVPYRVLGAVGIVGLAVLAEWAMTKDDKEKRARQVDRLPSERSRFVQFGKYRWPLSQEMAVVAAGMRYGLAQFTRDDPDGAEQLAQAIYNLLPPVASDLVQGDIIAPWPGWREVQEVAQNRQAYGNRPIIPERLADLPPALRRQESTSPTFDLLAAAARKGAIIVPPLAETSPLAVEHVVRGFLQNMTPLLTMVTDAMLARSEAGKSLNVPVPAPLTAHPLNPASAFVVREPPTRTSSESWFYQRAREFNQGESAERVVGKMEDLAETPAGQARAATARRLGGGTAWGLSEELAGDVGLIFKEAQLTLKDYRESETDIRQQVNDGVLAPQAARALLDSLTLERQHMLRETRNALQRLGVPEGTRSSTGTPKVPAMKTPTKAPYSPDNPFK